MERASWTLARLERAVEAFATQLQCAICLCAYDNPVSLPCNHCFCEECIHRALELKPLCPICKTPAKKRRLRYDTMIQQLLRANEMLGASPTPAAAPPADVAQDAVTTTDTAGSDSATNAEDAKAPESSTTDAPKRGTTPKKARKPSPVVATPLRVTRSSSASVAQEDSQTPVSPVLFEITTPRTAKTQEASVISASNPGRRAASPGRRAASPARPGRPPASPVAKQTPPPRKRPRRHVTSPPAESSDANASVLEMSVRDASHSTPVRQPASNKRRSQASSETTVDAVAADRDEATSELVPPAKPQFQVGDLVEVEERTWAGINKPGGTARVTAVNADGTYNVKFVIASGKENHVFSRFIHPPAEEITDDATPSRAAKRRPRRSVLEASPPSQSATSSAVKKRSGPSPKRKTKVKPKPRVKRSGMVFLCSGFKEKRMAEIEEWSELLGADVVQHWTNSVTHLIVKCVSGDEEEEDAEDAEDDAPSTPQTYFKTGKRKLFNDHPPKPAGGRWVKIRSLKYLKALVGGRWIVSDDWLQACAVRGEHVNEADYEADGHLKGKRIHDAVRRSRQAREKLLQLVSSDVDPSSLGTMLFAGFCFHVTGEFLPPMPPPSELDTLLRMGGGRLIPVLDDVEREMDKHENRSRRLVIVSDKINPHALREEIKELRDLPQLQARPSTAIVSYQWVLNSISEAKLRPFP